MSTISETLITGVKTSIHPPKRLLYGPGPSQVYPRIYQAMAQPIVGHLDPYFFQVSQDLRKGLRTAFGTENELTIPISATGSGGMETAISNFIEPGTKLALFVSGFFGERIGEMAKRHGAVITRLEKPWGGSFSDDEAAEFIRRERPQVVAFVQAETSTGVYQQSKALCDAAHEVEAIVIADCVTSLGAMPVDVDANGIDVAYSCSQKGLSAPPGLSPITISPRAQERLTQRKQPNRSWYFDLALIQDYLVSHRYHHTASATLFYAVREALAIIEDEGLALRHQRHQRAHERFVTGIERLGLKMHVAPGHRIWNLNTPRVPEGINEAKVRAYLLEKHGIEIAGGFGPLAGKIFRIGIMGPLATDEGVDRFLAKFDEAMKETA
ncbi:MAG TPA: alanine--glyoxylate aminotransferase family protein [Candidatus Saccharimonadales bacterium]|nr:alanine--glyoxylate aminotransferase family protein [Candidatus Saccharimonadales bacterium]